VVSGVVLAGRIGADSPELWVLQAPFPALLGGVAAWWASRRVADWYEGDYLESSSA
jgi:hypothetical protein